MLTADHKMLGLPTQNPEAPETEMRGNFVLFLRVNDHAWIFNDPLGLVRIYLADNGRFLSSSWLAARAWQGSSDIDEGAAIEYILLGATHSDRTVAHGVNKLPLGQGLDLNVGKAYARFPSGVAGMDGVGDSGAFRFMGDSHRFAPRESISAVVDGMAKHVRTVFCEISDAYPGRTSAALSGGFDSRLILAGLLAQGQRPRLFVYGSEQSDDVHIARCVAQAEGLPIAVIDKDSANGKLAEPELEELVQSALFFDGLPNDGIIDPGADRSTRLAQSADGFIALNGGGGEIFRNFFHLPDQRYRPRDIVRAFYRGFDAGAFLHAGGLADYENQLCDAIIRSLDLPGEADHYRGLSLSRGQVELVYPLFRCHHWMGLNNSIALRYGHFATPLLDLQTVRAAAILPMAWKNAGLFESRLIEAVHRSVAAHISSYGFSFTQGPGVRERCIELLTGLRPVFVRPLINAARRRLHRLVPSAELVTRYRAMLPGQWRLDAALDLGRLPDNAAFGRALAVEIVSRELS